MILLTGGSKSGKSNYALQLAKPYQNRAFIATAEAFDNEMKNRIDRHKKERSNTFQTFEESIEIVDVIQKIDGKFEVIILDCITVWLGNLLYRFDKDPTAVDKKVMALKDICNKMQTEIIVVTNEIGMGIIPDNALSRQFRDLAGTLNQEIAAIADKVIFMVSGLPLFLK